MSKFILSIPLYVNSYAYKKLEARFNVAHHLYNAILGECKRRKEKYLSSVEYIDSNVKYKAGLKEEGHELRKNAITKYGYYLRSNSYGRQNSIEQYTIKIIKNTWMNKHLTSDVYLSIAERAFKASEKTVKWVKTKHGFIKPKERFKKFGRDFIYSVDGKSANSPLKLKNNNVEWNGLKLPLILKDKDIKAKFELESDTIERKSVRLKRKLVKNKWNYYVDINCSGNPFIKTKNKLGVGIVGVDIGPSSIAYISDTKCELDTICNSTYNTDLVKDIQRKISRLRKLLNPDKYNKNGTSKYRTQYKTGWITSNKLKYLQKQYREIRRKNKESRRNSHGVICNKIRTLGDYIKLDKDSYKEWQVNRYGKSIENHAPSLLVGLLRDKFENTGGKFENINTKNSKSSQTCPNCGNILKKELKDRIHICICGFKYQRDLTSAIVNKYYNTELNSLNVNEANNFIMGKQSVLQTCIKELIQRVQQNTKFVGVAGTIPELQQIVSNGNESKNDA